jgi:galactonate dehydratase
MRISRVDRFQADGGWRPFSFLKMSTDEGLVGWSEYAVGPWVPGLSMVIDKTAEHVLGKDPRAYARLTSELQALCRFAPDGMNQQAIAAIENACVDIAAQAAGVAVHALSGGPYCDRLKLYWSHCGSFRLPYAKYFTEVLGRPALTGLDDVKRLGSEVAARGFELAKLNPMGFTPGALPSLLNPGFATKGLDFGRTLSRTTLDGIERQIEAFHDGLAPHCRAMLDLNFGFAPEGIDQIARRLAPFGLKWLEVDLPEPRALRDVRARATMPIASLETVYGRRGYNRCFVDHAADVAIVDVLWNGYAESVRIASLAESYELNVAPHNFYGPLADLMAAHFCAAIPNVDVMEIEADDVPWKYHLLTAQPAIENGMFHLPSGPGWGASMNEDALAEHPWRGPAILP